MPKPLQRIMHYVGLHGIVRPRDIEAIGLPREYLLRLHRQGKVVRSGRGLYSLPDAAITEHHSYAEVGRRVPGVVFCLLSTVSVGVSRNYGAEPSVGLDCPASGSAETSNYHSFSESCPALGTFADRGN